MAQPVPLSVLMNEAQTRGFVLAPRPKKTDRPTCGARCRSRLEGLRDGVPGMSPLAESVHSVLVSRGGHTTLGALLRLAPLAEVKAAMRELVAKGVAFYGTCNARVVVDRNADGSVRVRSRCRLHGGASTGASSAEGRERLAEAGRRGAKERWRRWRITRAEASAP